MDFATAAMDSLLNMFGELLKGELGELLKEKLKKYKLPKGVRKQVQSLVGELETMHAALRKVAEVPREQLDDEAKLWARDARELSYDMEDIVDTFLVRVEDGREATPNTHRLKQLMEKMGNWISKGKTCHQIAVVIEDINKQLQKVTKRHGRHPIDRIMAMPAALTPIDPRLQALYREVTELVGIYGKRDQELIKMLSEGDDVSNKKLKIVSVVGFGGLGKTTLVRAVYNKIKEDFDCWAFVPVGRNPDVKKVFRDILHELNCTDSNMKTLDERQLIDKLRKVLENKRYLIIIDDIWDEENWKYIKLAFSNGNNLGSRLITTTRKGSVSEACCSSSDDEVYNMEPLSNDDSQRLFYQRIFSDRNGCPPEFEQVSRDILKKCGGVPLAIITLASLLASNGQIKPKDEWYTLLNSIGRGLTEGDCVEEMQRILSFSYYDLPSQLKTCLLYLSIYPEDRVINRHELIWKWIAEGFIQCKKQQTSLFELGKSNFNELINRNMIQPEYFDRDGSATACRVHDMMLDLIRSLSSEENFVNILDGTEQSTPNSQSKVRRLSLQNSMVDETTPLVSVSQVRSITLFQPAIKLMPPLSSFDVLRVLDLCECDLGECSCLNLRPVGNLFHLRYLGLFGTGIHELPEEIGNLQFLQVLDVSDNVDLYYLPSTIVKLRRLMCLLVFGEYTMLPDGMGSLTSMEVLDSISTEGCPNIVKELRNLTRLRELEIRFGENESSKELEEAFVESLCNLHSVQSLVIHGYFGSMDLLGGRWVPPRHLRRFNTFVPNRFSTLPAWDPSLLPDLSDLWVDVKELRQEDLQILGRLSALHSLNIHSDHQSQRLLLVGADWFPCVILFDVACEPTGHIMFQQGALPRAQQVRFPFDVQMTKDDGNGDFGSVLENMLSLSRVTVRIHHDGATDGEVEEAKAALRHAVDAHPNHPTIDIATTYRADDNFFYSPRYLGCLEGGHKKKGANEGSNEGGNDGEGGNVNAKGKKMIRGPVTCKRCGEKGHRQASSKCPLNGTTKKRKRQPRKNSTKAKPGELSTPQRPTREQILQDSPGRMTRSRLAFLLGEGSSSQTSTATPERMPTAAASKKITRKRKLHIG